MKYEYCFQWNKKLSKPIEPLSEEQSRARFYREVPEADDWFTVVAFATTRCVVRGRSSTLRSRPTPRSQKHFSSTTTAAFISSMGSD